MINQTLALTILPLAFATHAACVTEPPEIGDIGPDSELVCKTLEQRFPGATLAVVNRSIHSPSQVSVAASVNGRPITLRYELSGYTWRLDESGARIADIPNSVRVRSISR